jgi:hypothetical protein
MAASRFVEVTDKEISEIKINSVPKNTKDLCKNTKTIIRLRFGDYFGNIHLDFVSTLNEYLSFIDPPLGGFGVIFPKVMIVTEYAESPERSSLREILRRIPRAEGL